MKSGYTIELSKRFEGLFKIDLPINYHGTIDDYVDACTALELNIRDIKDIELKSELEDYIKQAEEHNLDTTMHLPFVEASENGKVADCKMLWLVVPKSYSGFLEARELPVDEYKKCIDAASEHGIKYLTLHATSPGVHMTNGEFELFCKRINDLAIYAESKDTRLCVETGGLTEIELEYLINRFPVDITLDLAHAKIDRIDYEKFYETHKDRIPVIHLSQMNQEGKDVHWELHLPGPIDNASFLKMMAEDNKYVIYECSPENYHNEIKEFVENAKGN